MSPFGFLLIAHLIGDFLFQTRWMAINKATKWVPLLTHVGVYTFVVGLFAWVFFGGISVFGFILIFSTHILLDRKWFVQWWVRTIMGSGEKDQATTWLTIMADQIFHIIVLAIVLYI